MSVHGGNGEVFACGAATDLQLVAATLAKKGAPQSRIRGDDDALISPSCQLQPPGVGAEKELAAAAVLRFNSDQSGEADRRCLIERTKRQRSVTLQSAADILGAIGLSLSNIGGLQSGGVVFVVGEALGVGGSGMGRFGRLGEKSEVGIQGREDILQNFFFGHGGSVLS